MFHIPSVRGRRHSLALATVLALVLSAVAYWALSARRAGVPAVALTPSLTTAQPAAAEAFGPPWTLGGAAAFWQAVTWIYQHTRGNGQGVPPDTKPVWMTPAVQACLASERPQVIVRAQAEEAAAAGIHATPTVQILDRATGQALVLAGPAADDVLLSALDWLTSSERQTEQPVDPGMPVD